jgi:hypothetical protein
MSINFQSLAGIIDKWGVKMGVKLIKNGQKMGQKLIKKWSKKGSKMAFLYVEKMGGQKLIKKWSKNGQKNGQKLNKN